MNKRKLFQSKNYNAKNETKSSKFNLNNFGNKNYSKSKKQAGITLIALVISIIVMLILAGVSLNATIGDNGIITQAQNATYMQSIATLEEYLNNFYVEHYDDFNNEENKVQAMSKYNTSRDWFYQPMTGLGYIVDSSGNIHYFINKANLPTEIKNQLKGGDAGSGTYADYARMNDVYGVTTDLKVYYCANGNDSKMGAEESVKDKLDRKVFDSTNGIATYLKETFPDIIKTDENGNILLENLNVIQELDLDANENPNINFSDFYNFTSLKIVKLYNYNNVSLNGFQNLALLERLYIENSDISDYSAINNLYTLTHLYLLKSNNANVEKMSSALANSNLPNLKYLGIASNIISSSLEDNRGVTGQKTEVTDLSPLNRISETTRNAVRYLWLNNNQIENLNGLENFKNMYQLVVLDNSNLTTLAGIENMTGLKYLYAQSCKKLENISALSNCTQLLLAVLMSNNKITTLDSMQNASNILSLYCDSCDIKNLNALSNKLKLNYLSLRNNNNLTGVNAIKTDTAIRKLYLKNNNNINMSDVREISNIIKNCIEIELPSKYYAVLEGTTRKEYRNLNLNDNSDEILALEGDTICTELSLEGNSNLGSTESSKQKLYKILGSMTNLKALQLNGVKNIDSIEWIKTMPNLVELDLRGTAITDLSILNTYAINLETLLIDNENIALKDIQTTINRLGDYGYSKTLLGLHNNIKTTGLQIFNQKLANKLTDCTEITRFYLKEYPNLPNGLTFDLSNCNQLTDFKSKYYCTEKYILPSSVQKVECSWINTWPDLSRCTQITEFVYHDLYYCTDEKIENLFKELGKCQNLKKVELTAFHYDKVRGIENLENTKIEKLTICGSYNTGWNNPLLASLNNIDGIGNLKTLKSLTINYSSIKKLDALAGCESLETLTMQYGQLNDISGIANCTNLKAINFSGDNQIQHSIIYNLEPLSNLTNLEVANFNYNSINNLHGIENLQKLRVLSLNNNAITNYVSTNNGQINNLEILANLNKYSLRELYLNNNKIDDFSILKNITNWSNKSGW